MPYGGLTVAHQTHEQRKCMFASEVETPTTEPAAQLREWRFDRMCASGKLSPPSTGDDVAERRVN